MPSASLACAFGARESCAPLLPLWRFACFGSLAPSTVAPLCRVSLQARAWPCSGVSGLHTKPQGLLLVPFKVRQQFGAASVWEQPEKCNRVAGNTTQCDPVGDTGLTRNLDLSCAPTAGEAKGRPGTGRRLRAVRGNHKLASLPGTLDCQCALVSACRGLMDHHEQFTSSWGARPWQPLRRLRQRHQRPWGRRRMPPPGSTRACTSSRETGCP